MQDGPLQGAASLHRIEVCPVEADSGENRESIPAADTANGSECVGSARTIDLSDRDEEKKVVVGLIERRLLRETVSRRRFEAEISEVLRERAHPLVRRCGHRVLLRRRKCVEITDVDLGTRARRRGVRRSVRPTRKAKRYQNVQESEPSEISRHEHNYSAGSTHEPHISGSVAAEPETTVGLESIPGTKHDAQILVVLRNYKPEI